MKKYKDHPLNNCVVKVEENLEEVLAFWKQQGVEFKGIDERYSYVGIIIGIADGIRFSEGDFLKGAKVIQLPPIKHYKLIPERVEEFNALMHCSFKENDTFTKESKVQVRNLKNINKLYSWFYPVFEDIEPPIEKSRLCLVRDSKQESWKLAISDGENRFDIVLENYKGFYSNYNYVKPLPKSFEL